MIIIGSLGLRFYKRTQLFNLNYLICGLSSTIFKQSKKNLLSLNQNLLSMTCNYDSIMLIIVVIV